MSIQYTLKPRKMKEAVDIYTRGQCCVFCGIDTDDKIVRFTPEILGRSQSLLNVRIAHGLKYCNARLPSTPNNYDGYHTKCYKNFSALQKKYRELNLTSSNFGNHSLGEIFEEISIKSEFPVVEQPTRTCYFCGEERKMHKGKSQRLLSCKVSSFEIIKPSRAGMDELRIKGEEDTSGAVSYHSVCRVEYKNRFKSSFHTNSMPLQQRLTMAGNKVPQDDSLLAPTLKSQPLSPTKLKVTRHAAAAEEKIETPHTALLEEVCLRWNSHHSNMQTAFPSLLSKEQYCDVTLVADGKSLKCHKLILSSCSSYFDQVLEKIMPYQHPVIFMKDIPFNILKSLCDFMYAGEVNILQSDLDQLLAVGESLKIKGLANRSEPDTVNIPSPKDPVEEVSEAPLSKSTKSTVRPSTSEKKSLPRTKELVDRVTDPLDLMEPTYEEEATPDLPPAVLKRNDQTRKSTGKRVRKRKHVENDHEPSPPIFQTRKGTRSRPNVKVPRYFNASFDNSNDKTAVADTSSEIHQGSEEAMVDPLLDMVEEIKTEPVDIEDGLISYGEESYDMGEEPASTTGLFKKINSASAKLIVTKQEKEDAPDPLNTEQVDDRPKQVEEKGVENNNGEEDASGVIGETQTTLTQENSTTENERAEENAVNENLVENNVQDEEMGQMTTLSIAGTFDAVDQSQESAT